LRSAITVGLVIALPVAALAGGHAGGGGGHPSGGGGGRPSSGGGSHPAVQARSAPAQAPQYRSSGSSYHAVPTQRTSASARTSASHYSAGWHSFSTNATGRASSSAPYERAIRNPRHWGSWGWNHGVIWYPGRLYWGGGFWGPFAFTSLGAAFFYGSIIDYQDQMIFPSYEIAPSSPGSLLLENYGLQQTPCGPPDLVVIWGPDDSVICAYPNYLVAPGNYELDPSTLTIVSR